MRPRTNCIGDDAGQDHRGSFTGRGRKARRITEVVEALETQTERLALANERADQERKNADKEPACERNKTRLRSTRRSPKAENERVAAKSAQSTAETAA